MKLTIISTFFLSGFISCQEPSLKQSLLSHRDSVSPNAISALDSFDLDSSAFINTGFPESVKQILYTTNDSLWLYVTKSFDSFERPQSFSLDSFKKIMKNNDFTLDSSNSKIIARKRQFNKRSTIMINNIKVDTISVGSQFWYLGRKYILTTQKWHE